jgi:hypothetical protein
METDLKDQIRDLIERGAQPVSFREISERRTARTHAIPRAAGRRRVILTGAGVGLAAAGCAAGLVIATASPSAPAPAGARPRLAEPSRQGATLVTAALIEHVASASSSALSSSGQERISYRCVKNGAVTSAGTDTVTYSGSNYNYAMHTAVPAFPDGSIRVVNGQFYIALPTTTAARVVWLHELGENTTPHFPEAATLLRLLSPAAKFRNAGTDVIGGVRLTHLHATQVSGLPDDPTLGRYANLVADDKSGVVPPGTLTALDLWADSDGVVHQMTIQLHGGDGQTTVTVTFSGFGQPQSITAPATSNAVPGNP